MIKLLFKIKALIHTVVVYEQTKLCNVDKLKMKEHVKIFIILTLILIQYMIIDLKIVAI